MFGREDYSEPCSCEMLQVQVLAAAVNVIWRGVRKAQNAEISALRRSWSDPE
jgi:hypothetical protein